MNKVNINNKVIQWLITVAEEGADYQFKDAVRYKKEEFAKNMLNTKSIIKEIQQRLDDAILEEKVEDRIAEIITK